MKSYREFKKGGIYNRVYVGDNSAYAKINGKETFEVLEIEPQLQVQVLFDQFGSAYTEDLRGGVITFGSPEEAFSEFELFEPADESEWFKKSVKVNSLQEGIDRKLIPNSLIENKRFGSRCFISMSGKGQFYGVEWHVGVEDKTDQPLLQSVFIVWKSWEELQADFRKYGTVILD